MPIGREDCAELVEEAFTEHAPQRKPVGANRRSALTPRPSVSPFRAYRLAPSIALPLSIARPCRRGGGLRRVFQRTTGRGSSGARVVSAGAVYESLLPVLPLVCTPSFFVRVLDVPSRRYTPGQMRWRRNGTARLAISNPFFLEDGSTKSTLPFADSGKAAE